MNYYPVILAGGDGSRLRRALEAFALDSRAEEWIPRIIRNANAVEEIHL